MSNMSLFGWLVLLVIIFIFASIKIRKEKLSLQKYVALVLLPPLLLGVGSYLWVLFEKSSITAGIPGMILIVTYGFLMMFPSLLFYAVHVLSLEKRFSLSPWKLFMWAGLLGGISALPYLIIAPFEFIFTPMITGSLAMMIVYYFTKWRA